MANKKKPQQRGLKRRFYSLRDLRKELAAENIEAVARDVVMKCVEEELSVFAAPYLSHPSPDDLIKLPPFVLKFAELETNDSAKVMLPKFPYEKLNGEEWPTNERLWIKLDDLIFDEPTYKRIKSAYLKGEVVTGDQGKHWGTKREAVFAAALQLLLTAIRDPDDVQFLKQRKDGTRDLVVSRLTQEIDNRRNQWPELKKVADKNPPGSSQANIRAHLTSAFKYGTKLKKF